MDSTNVILSVRPQHAEAIVEGRKMYEFRRSIFKQRDVEHVYVYSTSPVNRIVGLFEVASIIEDSPERVWERCHRHSAISESEFFRYFEGAEIAFAIKIARMRRFAVPLDPYSAIEGFTPPQSFCYHPSSVNDVDRKSAGSKAHSRRDD